MTRQEIVPAWTCHCEDPSATSPSVRPWRCVPARWIGKLLAIRRRGEGGDRSAGGAEDEGAGAAVGRSLRQVCTQYRFFTIDYISDLALLLAKLPFGGLRSLLSQILAEELGEGDAAKAHPEIYDRFLASIGVVPERAGALPAREPRHPGRTDGGIAPSRSGFRRGLARNGRRMPVPDLSVGHVRAPAGASVSPRARQPASTGSSGRSIPAKRTSSTAN